MKWWILLIDWIFSDWKLFFLFIYSSQHESLIWCNPFAWRLVSHIPFIGGFFFVHFISSYFQGFFHLSQYCIWFFEANLFVFTILCIESYSRCLQIAPQTEPNIFYLNIYLFFFFIWFGLLFNDSFTLEII